MEVVLNVHVKAGDGADYEDYERIITIFISTPAHTDKRLYVSNILKWDK